MDGNEQAIIGNTLGNTGRGFAQIAAYPTPLSQEVNILKCENGFIVRVGCKTFVSQSFTEISGGLELYFNDPTKAHEKFLKK